MKNNSSSPTILNFSDFALKRDKQIATFEMTDYFVHKSRQEKAWNLITAVKNSLRQDIFSSAEARKITAFLAGQFDIRLPAIEHAEAFSTSIVPGKSIKKRVRSPFKKRTKEGHELFLQLFLRLQTGVQENLLDYNGARSLVVEIVTRYPKARGCLQC